LQSHYKPQAKPISYQVIHNITNFDLKQKCICKLQTKRQKAQDCN